MRLAVESPDLDGLAIAVNHDIPALVLLFLVVNAVIGSMQFESDRA